ncbi:unnamed protein product [Heterobilharzia americana]|nr:unnamed protein product [Heterobilharzia americana]
MILLKNFPPIKVEVVNAIKLLKCEKEAGPYGIPPEALRTDAETTEDMLIPPLQKVWKEGKKGRYLQIGRRATWSNSKEGRPQCYQELARNHAAVHPMQAKY